MFSCSGMAHRYRYGISDLRFEIAERPACGARTLASCTGRYAWNAAALLVTLAVGWFGVTACLWAEERPLQISWRDLTNRAGGGKGAVQLASGDILGTRPRWRADETAVVCSRSTDGGRHWENLSVITKDGPGRDMGDGHLIQLPDGAVLFSYRHNFTGANKVRQYSVRVAISHDAGRSWQPHSVVAEATLDPAAEPEALRGLWASYLLRKRDGTLQCYYDDEDTPHREGLFRHQWLRMKTWDERQKQWTAPVTVSRAHHAQQLSRDGMASVIELGSGRLFCALESVQTSRPHANCIRYVTSDDGGRSWSWQREERRILYQTAKPNYLVVSPWISRSPGGALLCAFATEEDQPAPSVSGTHPQHLKLDLKYISSRDDGRTWTRDAQTLFTGKHRSYAPGILLLKDGALLVTFQDFATGGHGVLKGSQR